MLAGQCDQLIVLQTPTTTRDSTYRSAATSYSDFATVWAEVKPFSVSVPEPVVAGAPQSTMRLRIRTKEYVQGMRNDMRIKHDTGDGVRYYIVLDWNIIGMFVGIHITAAEWNEGRAT